MSFDSRLEIAIVGDDRPDLGVLKERILKQLDRDGMHHDVYADVEEAFREGRAHFRVHAAYLLELVDALAAMLPQLEFHARGFGEEFRTTWIAEYRDGRRIYIQGPWYYD